MALDGFAISNIIYELKNNIMGGRVDKIYQPEKDEIILQIRNKGTAYKLLLTANASSPRIHFTTIQKENPINAPLFCMVLRKHLSSGKIINITQPNFERIVNIHVESINELGDYSVKTLVFEIMGKHSNIILIDDKNNILESIKHISFDKSSVREVLPNRTYVLPPAQNKKNPLKTNFDEFMAIFKNSMPTKTQQLIYKSYNGISPILASEICNNANIDCSANTNEILDDQLNELYKAFNNIITLNIEEKFNPQIIYNENETVLDFTVFDFNIFKGLDKKIFSSISELLEFFYKSKDLTYRLNQKSQDLKRLISQNIERCAKKKDIQQKTLKDIANRDMLKLYGELITSNIYAIKKGMTKVTLNNFYSENFEEIEIRLDPNLTPAENAQKYFKKYNKEKRTFVALQEQIKQNNEELLYLESVLSSVNACTDEYDIKEIRTELSEQGFLKRQKNSKNNKQKNNKKAKPLHYISTDGFHIYVGKNNTQNDELTLRFAKPLDMWFHTKDIAGSHVIVVSEGKEIPNSTLNEAANLAAYYSKATNSSLVPVDYTPKKFVKKPNGAKPGMVIYETNKTAYITPNEKLIENMQKID
ncbi:Rqc2 family fibronectin-binding protein [[Clostridium] colinum]|uniref:Rqc2 family fibronectin-binding protein n=1 Tax=[Clostridium] colinum TaxID=36835 RepID=UPI002024F4CC|nr:NFACT RNA binding domain-containing protein [[Clostridium] colinum]